MIMIWYYDIVQVRILAHNTSKAQQDAHGLKVSFIAEKA